MALISSKWGIAVLVIIAVMLLLFIIGRKSVKTEVIIEAPPDEVWAVLTDVGKVKEWNKVLIPIEGELKEGSNLKYEFYQEEGGAAAVMDAKVKKLDQSKLINQSGGIPGVLTFNHKYILRLEGPDTKVQIHEVYRGVMVPFWNPQPVEKAYERLLLSLKERVHQLKKE